jgi:hypothetical protein
MKELVRTNDLVLLSFLRSLLSDAEIAHLVLDENMSVVEGSLGILPRRVLVEEARLDEARTLLAEAERGA